MSSSSGDESSSSAGDGLSQALTDQHEEIDPLSKGRRSIYIGHLPKGFEEAELKTYFEQFGDVTRVRVYRSFKTGRSKGFGFVEFKNAGVARTAAKAMDGYMLFTRTLQCSVVAPEKVHPRLYKFSGRRFGRSHNHKKAKYQQNRQRSEEQEGRRLRRLAEREEKRAADLKAAGIDYTFTGPSFADQLEKFESERKVGQKRTRRALADRNLSSAEPAAAEPRSKKTKNKSSERHGSSEEHQDKDNSTSGQRQSSKQKKSKKTSASKKKQSNPEPDALPTRSSRRLRTRKETGTPGNTGAATRRVTRSSSRKKK